jgi:hypothetical protein
VRCQRIGGAPNCRLAKSRRPGSAPPNSVHQSPWRDLIHDNVLAAGLAMICAVGGGNDGDTRVRPRHDLFQAASRRRTRACRNRIRCRHPQGPRECRTRIRSPTGVGAAIVERDTPVSGGPNPESSHELLRRACEAMRRAEMEPLMNRARVHVDAAQAWLKLAAQRSRVEARVKPLLMVDSKPHDTPISGPLAVNGYERPAE